MHRLTILLFVLALLGIGGGSVWYLIQTRNAALGIGEDMASTTPPLTEALAIYTNGTYGFTIFYPEAARVEYAFDPGYHLGSSWRAQALPDVQGTPVVSVIPYALASEDSYPRYFNAMVRIGVSDDPKELARCEKVSQDQGETQLPDRAINGHVWKAFSFQDAGMMQYASGVSYRTMHEGRCIALEQVRTGSSYRDEPSERDIPEEALMAEYDKLGSIIQSFSFAR